jgi:two-component system phosphate regulon response regulator PhoB
MPNEAILIVEDDEDIRNLVAYNVESAGFTAAVCADGREALELAAKTPPDLIVLDLMLPGLDGFEICKELKKNPKTADIPVIMLTAKGGEVDRVVGLELGAEDYVVKPFSPRELILRIKAVLKRFAPEKPDRETYQRGGVFIDPQAHRATTGGAEIALTATEFKLLTDLIKNPGRVRTRDQLLNTVWGYEFEGYARTVDTHVRRLRQKMGEHAECIETIRGVGYRFKE